MRDSGVIQGVQIALGRGVIRPDNAGDDIAFRREDLPEGAFEELREGQWVTFARVPDQADPTSIFAREIRSA
jgi:cold shock CspA family protein